MRTEYTIVTTFPNGKKQYDEYAKKYADLAEQKAKNCAEFYKDKNTKVEFFKVMWNGSSFYKAEKIW